MIEPTAATIAFHDWREPFNIEAWAECGLHFFHLVGAKPNAVTYWQGEGRTRRVSASYLSKVIQKKDVRSIGIHELMAPFDDLGDCRTEASFSIPTRARTSIFTYKSSAIDISLFSKIIRKFAECAKVTYGYAYLRPVSLGPAMYAYNLSFGLNPRIESERVEQQEMAVWGRERLDMIVQKTVAPFRHVNGFLRDVFPLNVLSRPHVTGNVFGEPLAKWIESEGWRGYLEEVCSGVWIWVIPEQNLPLVRKALQPTGILIVKPPE
jgi:hypothetical protein